uniref:acid phosphatase n=1 Tax=Trichuris muris TaxID=70415 RepID=A0A5S6R271_TRIMR
MDGSPTLSLLVYVHHRGLAQPQWFPVVTSNGGEQSVEIEAALSHCTSTANEVKLGPSGLTGLFVYPSLSLLEARWQQHRRSSSPSSFSSYIQLIAYAKTLSKIRGFPSSSVRRALLWSVAERKQAERPQCGSIASSYGFSYVAPARLEGSRVSQVFCSFAITLSRRPVKGRFRMAMFHLLLFVVFPIVVRSLANGPILLQLLQAEAEATPMNGLSQSDDEEMARRFPVGFGQLTVHGCNLSYGFGRYVRNMYHRLISPSYFASEVHIRSLDKDASISTALCFLQGLYPCEQCNPSCLRTGIPVHTESMDRDFLLNCKANCPGYKSIYEKETGETIKQLRHEFKAVFEKLKALSPKKKSETQAPRNDKSVVSIRRVQDIHDVLSSRRSVGLPLQGWGDPFAGRHRTLLGAFSHLANLTTYLEYNTLPKARLKAGYLIGTILNNMEMKLNESSGAGRKLYHYVTEKRCLVGLLTALNISANIPRHDFAIGFELLSRPSEHEVRVFVGVVCSSGLLMAKAGLSGAAGRLPQLDEHMVRAVVWNPPVVAENCSHEMNDLGMPSVAAPLVLIPCVANIPAKSQAPPPKDKGRRGRKHSARRNKESLCTGLEDKVSQLQAELDKLRAENKALQVELEKNRQLRQPANKNVDIVVPSCNSHNLSLAELAIGCFLCVLLVCRVIQPQPVDIFDEELQLTKSKRKFSERVTPRGCSSNGPNRRKKRRCN